MGGSVKIIYIFDPSSSKSLEWRRNSILEKTGFLNHSLKIPRISRLINKKLIFTGREENLLELVDSLEVIKSNSFHEIFVPETLELRNRELTRGLPRIWLLSEWK